MKGVEAVAYDWVAKNLYFVDRARDQIGICALGRSLAFCTQLMTSQARAIAVHPGYHMIFLGIHGSDGGRIERTFLDGSDRKISFLIFVGITLTFILDLCRSIGAG